MTSFFPNWSLDLQPLWQSDFVGRSFNRLTTTTKSDTSLWLIGIAIEKPQQTKTVLRENSISFRRFGRVLQRLYAFEFSIFPYFSTGAGEPDRGIPTDGYRWLSRERERVSNGEFPERAPLSLLRLAANKLPYYNKEAQRFTGCCSGLVGQSTSRFHQVNTHDSVSKILKCRFLDRSN